MSYVKNADLTAEIVRCQQDNVVSTKLALMLILMVNRYAMKPNWRYYSYLEDMKADAVLQLVKSSGANPRPTCLKFDLSYSQRTGKVPNGFAYCTTIITNAFKRFVKGEHALQHYRDDIIIAAGRKPSAGRQAEDEMERSADPIE